MTEKAWVVTGTSMVVHTPTADEAIERAQESSGWHWQAQEWQPQARPEDETLARFTVADAEAVLGRKLGDGEASSIRKSLEFALSEPFTDAVETHR